MLNAILRKRAQLLVVVLVISTLMIATTAFAVTKLIRAKTGGVLSIARGVRLVIPPRALEKDTVVSADVKVMRKYIAFRFRPHGTDFVKPAKLQIGWWALKGVEDFVLYERNGNEIEPRVNWWGLEYEISHFSLYYFRRR